MFGLENISLVLRLDCLESLIKKLGSFDLSKVITVIVYIDQSEASIYHIDQSEASITCRSICACALACLTSSSASSATLFWKCATLLSFCMVSSVLAVLDICSKVVHASCCLQGSFVKLNRRLFTLLLIFCQRHIFVSCPGKIQIFVCLLVVCQTSKTIIFNFCLYCLLVLVATAKVICLNKRKMPNFQQSYRTLSSQPFHFLLPT